MSALAHVVWFDMVPLGGRMLKKRSPASKALRAATLTALLALVALALALGRLALSVPPETNHYNHTTYVHACLWECAEDGRRERQVRAREHDECDLRGSVEVLHLALYWSRNVDCNVLCRKGILCGRRWRSPCECEDS